MFEWLVHSQTRLRMLKMFFKDIQKPLYGLEIAQNLNASPGTTHRELNAMLKQGVITKKREGALVMYRLNTQHPYFHELKKAIFPSKKPSGSRVLFISDLHLSPLTPGGLIDDLELLLDYARENATELVLVGDIIEMLEGDVFQTYLIHKPLFDRLNELSHHVNITYLVGNHDCYLSLLTMAGEGQKFFDAKITFAKEYLNPKLNIYATHGHSYDDFSDMKGFKATKSGVSNAQRLLASLKMVMASDEHKRALADLAGYAEQATAFAQYMSQKKIDSSEKFQNIAKQLIEDQDYSYVVFGHTHKAQVKHLGHGIYFNTGSWKSEKKRQFVEIDKDGGALVALEDLR